MARIGVRRGAYSALVGRPEGRTPLGRSRCRWEVNITMGIQEVGWGDTNWITVATIGTDGGLL